jgi:hypothetical protein
LRLRTDVNNGLWVGFHQAYGWATFLNDVIKLSAGIIDDGAWGSGGMEGYAINGTGVRFEITPIAGLNLGLMLRYSTDAPPPVTIKQFLSETAFGAKYESDLFWLAGGLILDSDADKLATNADLKWHADVAAAGAPDSDQGLDFYAGAGVTALPGLTVSVEARARNAAKFADYGQFVLDEKASYKLLDDKVEVGLKAYQYFWAEDGSKGLNVNPSTTAETLKPYLTFNPYVAYDVLDNVNVAFDVTFGLWKDNIDYELGFKPKVTYKIGDGAKIVAFYKLDILDFYEDIEINGRKTNKGNTIQVDLIWEF